ncbi:MAG: 50S ribosomal protein L25 [Phycisphaerae bacterium]
MSKASAIKAQPRKDVGTQATRRYRLKGFLPGIVYGHKQETLAVAVPAMEFIHMLKHGSHLFELQMDDHSETVLVKEVQYDYLGTDPIHVDFGRVDLNERVPVAVPLVLRGIAAGVTAGGVLQQILMQLQIECLVTDIPEQIRMNVSKLELNQSLHAGDITLPEGAKLLLEPGTVVAVVSTIAEEEVAPAAVGAEDAAEPEVITKGKEKEEGEEEGAEAEKKA